MVNERAAPEALATLVHQKHVSLTTYRKSGAAVATPVWFVINAGGLYIETPSGSGKVKRIRNNGCAALAPCTARGKQTGPAIPVRASLLAADSAGPVNAALVKRYGVLKRLVNAYVRIRRIPQVSIWVLPA